MKILVVDDDPIALKLLETCLADADFSDLTLVGTSSEATDLLNDPLLDFDCFLLDISMPERNGIEICKDVRSIARYLNTPVLMVTGLDNARSIQEAFAAGATDYITKPFEFSEVIARVKFAQRMVVERKASLERYLSLDGNYKKPLRQAPKATYENANLPSSTDVFEGQDAALLPMSVMENYVSKMTDTKDCHVSIRGIVVENINQLSGELSKEKFDALISIFVEAAKKYSTDHHVFLSYLGDGAFLCAADRAKCDNSADLEEGILGCMIEMAKGTQVSLYSKFDITAGLPAYLLPCKKPNFNRLLKVAMARIEARRDEKLELYRQSA
jgi:DNA-binding response OmpR family regulator